MIMKITRRQLRRLIKEEVQGILEAGKGGSADVAYPGDLGIPTPAGENIDEEDAAAHGEEEEDVDDEIRATTAKMQTDKGAQATVDRDQLRMLTQKQTDLADVSG